LVRLHRTRGHTCADRRQAESEINKVLRDPEMKARFRAQGADLTESTPEECASFVRAELAQWGKMFGSLGIRPE
jgi:tripartite-type tricarboxylate transporter receptor subunit TctC